MQRPNSHRQIVFIRLYAAQLAVITDDADVFLTSADNMRGMGVHVEVREILVCRQIFRR